MQKKYVLIILLLSTTLWAQEVERITVKGKVTALEKADVEGVTIYNNSSNKGVITNETGDFTLDVAINDEIVISSIQYTTFKITVDAEILQRKTLAIYLNPVVNKLAEVIVRPYDLTGLLNVDAASIKTVDLDTEWDLSWETMEFEYEFSDDQYSAIRGNAAEEALGFHYIGGAGINIAQLRQWLFPNREPSKREKLTTADDLLNAVRAKFDTETLVKIFKIQEDKTGTFIYYAIDNGLNQDLLKVENEMLLIQFMRDTAMAFNTAGEN